MLVFYFSFLTKACWTMYNTKLGARQDGQRLMRHVRVIIFHRRRDDFQFEKKLKYKIAKPKSIDLSRKRQHRLFIIRNLSSNRLTFSRKILLFTQSISERLSQGFWIYCQRKQLIFVKFSATKQFLLFFSVVTERIVSRTKIYWERAVNTRRHMRRLYVCYFKVGSWFFSMIVFLGNFSKKLCG